MNQGQILDRMTYLEKKIQECSTAIKYKNLSGTDLSIMTSDLRMYENEHKDLKLKLADTDGTEGEDND